MVHDWGIIIIIYTIYIETYFHLVQAHFYTSMFSSLVFHHLYLYFPYIYIVIHNMSMRHLPYYPYRMGV